MIFLAPNQYYEYHSPTLHPSPGSHSRPVGDASDLAFNSSKPRFTSATCWLVSCGGGPPYPVHSLFLGKKLGSIWIYIYICGSIEFFRLRMGSSTEIYPRNMMKHVESVESWSVVTCGTLEVAELFPSFQQPLKRLVDPIPGRSSTNLLRLPETSASLSWVVASSVPDFWSELPVGEFTEKHMSYHDPGCHGVWCAKIITIRAPCIQYCKKHMANLTNNSATKSLWADSATNKHTHTI